MWSKLRQMDKSADRHWRQLRIPDLSRTRSACSSRIFDLYQMDKRKLSRLTQIELQLTSPPICSLSPSRICKLIKVSLVVWTNSSSNSRLMHYRCNSNNTNRTLVQMQTRNKHFIPSTLAIQKPNRSHTHKDRASFHSHQTIIWWTLKRQQAWETLLPLWPSIKTIPVSQRACQMAKAMHSTYQSRS